MIDSGLVAAAFAAALLSFAVAGLIGASAGLLGRPQLATRVSIGLSAAGSLAVLLLGIGLVLGGGTVSWQAGSSLGFAVIDVRFDALAGVFLLALGAVGFAAALEALDEAGTAPANAMTRVAHPAFLLALLLVFGSASAFAFLLAWEVMALASAVLVIGVRPRPAQLSAGYVYLAATHLATGGLVIAFAVLAAQAGGAMDFATWTRAAPTLDPLVRDAVFLLLVLGFGTKAGVMPFHVWLPRAHPAAPSHVSALMSGVMIKTGIFGLIRVGGEVLGPGPDWWGLLLIGLGAVSAVLGVLYALMEHDLKRLLAFSSIENVGVILIALGAAFVLRSAGLDEAAGIALAAALLHTLNHGLFKGLLFLGAGAVQHAAGTRDLNRLGGLARRMPRTALAFGVGAVAIAGIPPLNGFLGEWATFQSLVGVAAVPTSAVDALARSVAVIGIGALALAAALALGAGVKVTGTAFLALPRSPGAAAAHEAQRPTLAAMGLLAAACVAAGLGGGWLAGAFGEVAAGVLAVPVPTVSPAAPPLPVGAGVVAAVPGQFVPLPLALLAGTLALGTVVTAGLLRVAARTRSVETWTCGVTPDPAFAYTATSFGKPVRLFFRSLLRPTRRIDVEHHPGTRVPRSIAYRGAVGHVIDRHLYGRPHAALIGAAQAARRLQNGSLQLYLAYTIVAVAVLLLVTR
jgi:hydrogenase-4 component B